MDQNKIELLKDQVTKEKMKKKLQVINRYVNYKEKGSTT